MGVSTKYGFGLYREIKEIRQKNDGSLTKYGFGFNKEIKEFGADKLWVFQRSMDLNLIKK